MLGAALGGISGYLNQGDLTSFISMMLFATVVGNLLMMTIPKKREKEVLRKIQSGEIEAA